MGAGQRNGPDERSEAADEGRHEAWRQSELRDEHAADVQRVRHRGVAEGRRVKTSIRGR